MHITQSWFYILADETITIADNLEVVLFDDGNQNRHITLGESTHAEVYGCIIWEQIRENVFLQQDESSELTVRYVLASKDRAELRAKIFSELAGSYTKSDVQITSIISEAWTIKLDGCIQINKNIVGADANLIEENLFLGTTGSLQWIPTLLVGSDDVKAAHACRVEKISDEKLFYLRSRWIAKDEAMRTMIEAYIHSNLSGLKEHDADLYQQIFEDILAYI